jgi:hypothetical protein
MHPIEAALYARVSTDQQTRGQTIVSQVAALRERVAVDGLVLDPEHVFVDDGVSGTAYCVLLLSGCVTRSPWAASIAFTSNPRTAWLDAMLIRCSLLRSSAAPEPKSYS